MFLIWTPPFLTVVLRENEHLYTEVHSFVVNPLGDLSRGELAFQDEMVRLRFIKNDCFGRVSREERGTPETYPPFT